MMDYDVIVRIPIRASEPREAHETASGLAMTIRAMVHSDAEVSEVECTGPSEET